MVPESDLCFSFHSSVFECTALFLFVLSVFYSSIGLFPEKLTIPQSTLFLWYVGKVLNV